MRPTYLFVFACSIVGFTAWASSREPSQVLELLERVYGDFDRLARRRKVFKVETVGDVSPICFVPPASLCPLH